jgi:hypothetical protein
MITAHTRRSRRILLTAAAAVAMLTVAAPQARAQGIPPVPPNLEAPAGHTPFLIAHAYGTQNYICTHGHGGFEWTFFGPQATLFDDNGQQIATHFLSPNPDENEKPRATWQHSQDSSAVWAVAVASSTDSDFVDPDAIPWLLLQAVGAEDGPIPGGAFSWTTYLQRVNTAGGLAPQGGCSRALDLGLKALVPYRADYVFYRH